jgi:hypothetical protein
MTTGVGVAILIGTLQAVAISGSVPPGAGSFEPTGHVLWVPAEQSRDDQRHECVLSATRWSCPTVPHGESGVVILVGNGAIGYVVLGPPGPIASGNAEWGRLVRVVSGLSVETLSDLRVSSWTVERPPSRPNTQKLDVVPDTTFQVVRISATSFWVSGPSPSSDAFLRLDGSGVAQHNTTMHALADGPLDSPFVIDATSGVAITGRVETRSGEPADGAVIELFARTPGGSDGPVDEKSLANVPIVRLATTVADKEGQFEFGGLESGPYQVVATAFSRGRLARWTTTVSPPLLITLEPPATATGRIVRHKLPVPDVKVRFVPGQAAWRNSSDPSAHLTADVTTDESGRFTLPLPPTPSGDVQFIAPDGASKRISLPALSSLSEITLGDVALPELISVVLRADVAGCRLTAIGPTGALGFALATGRATATSYQLDLPEPGEWFLDAECAGQHASLQPSVILLKSGRSSASFDVRIVTSDSARSPR